MYHFSQWLCFCVLYTSLILLNKGEDKISRSIQKSKIKQNAYFTIEAALIIPLALGILIFLIFIMFYQYDRCLLEQDIGMVAFWGATVKAQDNQILLEEMQNREANVYWKKYILFFPQDLNVSIGNGKVSVQKKGDISILFNDLATVPDLKKWEIASSYSNRRLSPKFILRIIRKKYK